MASRKCSTCGERWPPDRDYDKCPRCPTNTWFCMDDPITRAEASSIVKHIEFDAFFLEWDEKRVQSLLDAGCPDHPPDQ